MTASMASPGGSDGDATSAASRNRSVGVDGFPQRDWIFFSWDFSILFFEIGLDLLERSLGFVSCVLRLDLGGFYDFSVCLGNQTRIERNTAIWEGFFSASLNRTILFFSFYMFFRPFILYKICVYKASVFPVRLYFYDFGSGGGGRMKLQRMEEVTIGKIQIF